MSAEENSRQLRINNKDCNTCKNRCKHLTGTCKPPMRETVFADEMPDDCKNYKPIIENGEAGTES